MSAYRPKSHCSELLLLVCEIADPILLLSGIFSLFTASNGETEVKSIELIHRTTGDRPDCENTRKSVCSSPPPLLASIGLSESTS
jgi:hypothetical protein